MRILLITVLSFTISVLGFSQPKKTIKYKYARIEFGPTFGVGSQTPATGNIQVPTKSSLDFGWQWHIKLDRKSHLLFNSSYSNNKIDMEKLRNQISGYYQKTGHYQYVEISKESWSNMQYSLAYAYQVYANKINIAPFLGVSAVQILDIPYYQVFSRNTMTPYNKEVYYVKRSNRSRFIGGLLAGSQFTKRFSRLSTVYVQPEIAFHFGAYKADEYVGYPGYNSTTGRPNETIQNINYGLTGLRYGIKIGVMFTPFNRILEGEK